MLHRSVWRPGSAQTRWERLQRCPCPSWIKEKGRGRAVNAEGKKGGQERGKEGTEKEGRRVERRKKAAILGDLGMYPLWEGSGSYPIISDVLATPMDMSGTVTRRD